MHYALLLITDEMPTKEDIALWMAPYDSKFPYPHHVKRTKDEIIEHEKYTIRKSARFARDMVKDGKMTKEAYQENFGHLLTMLETEDDVGIFLEAIKDCEEKDIDDVGNLISTENPKGNWDWYDIGGRYKDIIGKRSVKVKNFPKPIEGSDEELAITYAEDYEDYKKLLKGELPMPTPYRTSYVKRRFPTFKSYLIGTLGAVTYAVFNTITGEWSQPGKANMMNLKVDFEVDAEDDAKWDENYYNDIIKPLDGNYYLTVLDCHID